MFTPEELAELAAFDAEIDETFVMTPEDYQRSRECDGYAKAQHLDNREKNRAEKQRAYYEANKAEIAEKRRKKRMCLKKMEVGHG